MVKKIYWMKLVYISETYLSIFALGFDFFRKSTECVSHTVKYHGFFFHFWKFSFKGMKFSETLVSWILIRWRNFWNFRLMNFAIIFPSGNISTFYSILSCASTNGTRKNLKVSFDSCFVCNESKWFSCQWASRFSLSDLNPGPVHWEKKKVIKKFIFKGFILDEMNWLSEQPTTDSLVHPEY